MAFHSGRSGSSSLTSWWTAIRARRGRVAQRPARERGWRSCGTGRAGSACSGGVVAIGQGVQRHVALKTTKRRCRHLDGDGTVTAPMHGKVLAIFVAAGASVTKGERVLWSRR